MCVSVEDVSGTVSGTKYSGYTLPSDISIGGASLITAVIPPNLRETSRALLAIEALMINSDYSQDEKHCTGTPFAIRATLSPCIHTYTNISYTNAKFSEKTISSTTKLPYIPHLQQCSLAVAYPARPSLDCTASSTRGELKTEAAQTLPSGVHYHVPFFSVAKDANTLYYDTGCVYDFGYRPTVGLENAFKTTLFETLVNPFNVTIQGLPSRPSGDSWLLPLYAEGRADMSIAERYFKGLATTMTAAIREGGHLIGSEPARGTVMANQTCVGVDWAWLALPILLVVLMAVILVLTMAMSRRSRRVKGSGGKSGKEAGRSAWKSSTLPLLWCGISDKIRDRYYAFDKVKKMKEAGDGLRVQLVRQEGHGFGHSTPIGNEKRRWMLK